MKPRKLDVTRLPISDAVRRLNPELFTASGALGAVGATKHRQPAGALVGRQAPQPSRPARLVAGAEVTVTLVAHLARRLDTDNLAHALKPLRDAIAGTLEVDDGDERLRWEYGQVETRGREGVTVKVEAKGNTQ
jgi:hypothetical protein